MLTLIVLVVASVSAQDASRKRVHITVLGTTDLHGNIYPIDYYTDKPDNRGLAKVATLIKRVAKKTPTPC